MATKVAPTLAQIEAWAKTSTRPNGDCQGFAGNDFTSHFGTFTTGYTSANAALAAAKAEGHFHTGTPPSDGRVYWVFFKFPTYGHVMLFINGVCIGDTSHATKFLNAKKTVGTMKISDYPKAYAYLGYSTSNGKNTVPAPVSVPVFKSKLTAAEIKQLATYLNGRKLGESTTANTTGLVQSPGAATSNYYWLVQEAALKDGLSTTKPTGVPTATTYSLEEQYYTRLTAPPVTTPPVTTPPVVVPPAGVLNLTAEQVEALDAAYKAIGAILNK